MRLVAITADTWSAACKTACDSAWPVLAGVEQLVVSGDAADLLLPVQQVFLHKASRQPYPQVVSK